MGACCCAVEKAPSQAVPFEKLESRAEADGGPPEEPTAEEKKLEVRRSIHQTEVEAEELARKFPDSPPQPKEEAPAPEEPKEEMGGYLLYDASDRGKLLLSWSKTPVEGALAVSYPGPGVVVPGYKLKSKQEVCRNIQSSKELYFAGWISYIKAVRVYCCKVKLLPHPQNDDKLLPPVKLAFHLPDNSVTVLNATKPEGEVLTTDSDAVAAYGCNNDVFDGVQVILVTVFVQKGRAIEDGDAQSL